MFILVCGFLRRCCLSLLVVGFVWFGFVYCMYVNSVDA